VKLVGGRRVFSVEEVSARLAAMFEGLRSFWLEAEVQDLRPARGQVYFRLRGGTTLDATMNGVVYERLAHKPRDGALVQAYGRIEFWSARGAITMRVERLELAGEGLLRAQVEELRGRLAAEGLLEPARKRPVPLLPRRVGLVTSPDGAARDDFLTNAFARFPRADVVVVGVPVQGDTAPPSIVRALAHLDAREDVDVIVVARGGGSLEDLMAFNSEAVCRAVASATTPVVSAVGHERDVTLCDEVADLRVSTPSAAAAAVLPSLEALEVRLADHGVALRRGLVRERARAAEAVGRRSADLARALRGRGGLARDRVDRLAPRLAPALGRAAARAAAALDGAGAGLRRAATSRAQVAAGRVERAEALLALLSPRRTVARGYAIVRAGDDGRVVGSVAGVAPGDALSIEMRDGRLAARAEA
jgi:exodeoxyribonuclease VII large subunit